MSKKNSKKQAAKKKAKKTTKKAAKKTTTPDPPTPPEFGVFQLDGSVFDLSSPVADTETLLIKRGDEFVMQLSEGLFRQAVAAGMLVEDMAALLTCGALAYALQEQDPPTGAGTPSAVEFPPELLERAKKKVGLTDVQIATYRTPELLKKFLDGVSPKTNPDARPKISKPAKPKQFDENRPDKFEFESRMEAKFLTMNRPQFDEATLQQELRKINRRYGAQKPVRILKDVNCKPVKGKNKDKQTANMLVTKFTVFMK